jgi:hypothetical protein
VRLAQPHMYPVTNMNNMSVRYQETILSDGDPSDSLCIKHVSQVEPNDPPTGCPLEVAVGTIRSFVEVNAFEVT